jgi:hypothetical protein
MADYIYNSEGRPQGFRLGNAIYAMDGTPLGRVWAEKVYTFGGSYVGAIFNNMVVDRPNVSRRKLPPVTVPERAAPRGRAETRRGVGEPFPDCFALLLPDGAEQATPPEGAVEAETW